MRQMSETGDDSIFACKLRIRLVLNVQRQQKEVKRADVNDYVILTAIDRHTNNRVMHLSVTLYNKHYFTIHMVCT